MSLEKIFAHVSCSDLATSTHWYARLFGRERDVSPMQALHEWHHGESTGLQLFLDGDAAGQSTLTLIVSDLDEHRQALVDRQLVPGEIEHGDAVRLIRLNDPDGNLIVLAEPDPK